MRRILSAPMGRTSIPRWLELQEQIDFLHFQLGQIHREMPRTALDSMIDDATGATAERLRSIHAIARRMKRLKKQWSRETGQPASTEMEDQILRLRTP